MYSQKKRPKGLRFDDCGGRYWFPHDQPSAIYSSETNNPSLVERKFELILHKYFEISRSLAFISAALKGQFT